MWGLNRFQHTPSSTTPTPAAANMFTEGQKIWAAEEATKEDGVAECVYCELEIRYNPGMGGGGWTWESEDLIGLCDGSAKSNKHQPKIKK